MARNYEDNAPCIKVCEKSDTADIQQIVAKRAKQFVEKEENENDEDDTHKKEEEEEEEFID